MEPACPPERLDLFRRQRRRLLRQVIRDEVEHQVLVATLQRVPGQDVAQRAQRDGNERRYGNALDATRHDVLAGDQHLRQNAGNARVQARRQRRVMLDTVGEEDDVVRRNREVIHDLHDHVEFLRRDLRVLLLQQHVGEDARSDDHQLLGAEREEVLGEHRLQASQQGGEPVRVVAAGHQLALRFVRLDPLDEERAMLRVDFMHRCHRRRQPLEPVHVDVLVMVQIRLHDVADRVDAPGHQLRALEDLSTAQVKAGNSARNACGTSATSRRTNPWNCLPLYVPNSLAMTRSLSLTRSSKQHSHALCRTSGAVTCDSCWRMYARYSAWTETPMWAATAQTATAVLMFG
ncbi:hypothetical protein PBRA_000265 [Plasmodiophora brassicae]|uniref:Uncharacterized protein n=1 Tax=Plasmodiophora brassicae TaxID=37360 RepID=A0A0G4IH77_PLABS|nr:hypothetical protein PBRA_000265 [Plasmodiophora brassicae]